jgi:hypothetical protein
MALAKLADVICDILLLKGNGQPELPFGTPRVNAACLIGSVKPDQTFSVHGLFNAVGILWLLTGPD